MCGLAGYIDTLSAGRVQRRIVERMTETLIHRGPDNVGHFVAENIGMGFRRLSIIDPETGDQPLFNEDRSLVLACNGEIYNYLELKAGLIERGHRFRSNTDVEVLLHLFEEQGADFLNQINGQFALAIYDTKSHRLFIARDQFGICPLFYTLVDGLFIFGSEIKSILKHPLVRRKVDLTGLDQVLTMPGTIAPRTMFQDIHSLPGGNFLVVENNEIRVSEYWDLVYPETNQAHEPRSESFYAEALRSLFEQSVRYRLQADVAVGFFLSGGLDSSFIAAMIRHVSPGSERHSFSVNFSDESICESRYQKLMSEYVKSTHHMVLFDDADIASRLRRVVYHSECPLRETYNTASYALAECTRRNGITVVLNGEGADELFAGYIGYRFDKQRRATTRTQDLQTILGDEIREKMWGDPGLSYERDEYASKEMRQALYSAGLNALFDEFDCANFPLINKTRIKGIDPIHKRSYLDFKLRLAGHLIADHGDRMAMANSVEARYPFLDREFVEFCRDIPADLKLCGFNEKKILKQAAAGLVPKKIVTREKFGFVAPGSPSLLKQNLEWVNDMLSYGRIQRQGYFNANTIEALKLKSSQDGFKLDFALEDDWLIIVLTFSLFLEVFDIPELS